ncbi:MAG: hypothetical protein DKM50_02390 [Candidatus Margulisiibacteriota bacterium]|nr:MAG: hypothetical protein A2X43_06840 [Candidatus Margulisbacteria bacterium GWD2_39_127]OGI05265.1 MAG: hypothetical protein A2X42_03645 [Candidatus Margulisbacteria bacterium GWF2_38_17]OGI10876.1 MAG: hypothetical protein A2X41_05830 [Candidatus Margulisbacteria bacterium GWE2_39_32]PZM83564.1 MAG: hypothetical protein DKM50_02390 [Candidatus Margulisiibacteriota bacterium]HAR64258.1 hypothetical protein [Candidatus Margulisiibacteriota bacterium]
MKGVIAICLEQLVVEKFGKDKWEKVLTSIGLPADTKFLPTADIDDAAVMAAIKATCTVLGITLAQAADAFGDYWVNVYAKNMYGAYYLKPKNAKEFLLAMDKVHERTTMTVANAHPPRFEYEEKDAKTLIMKYQSKRGLIDILMGLVKGVGKHFNESLKVTKLDESRLQIVFP